MTLTRRDRILLVGLAAAVLAAAVWWFVVRPAQADAASRRDQLTQIRSETGGIRDTIERLRADGTSAVKTTAERLRLAEAVPPRPDTPGAVLQLHRLADQANVELTSIRVNAVHDFGALRSTEYELKVTGRFFEADDFLYRLHALVAVGPHGRPSVAGRLFATTAIDINLAQPVTGEDDLTSFDDTDAVVATIRVRSFSAGGGGSSHADGTDAAAAPGTP